MSLAALKRKLGVGVKLKLVRHDWLKPGGRLTLGEVREIAIRQGNAIAFATPASDSGVSWLYWPAAAGVRIDEKGFDIDLWRGEEKPKQPFEEIMRYEFLTEGGTDDVTDTTGRPADRA